MKILAIGNSFSQDATRYIHQIAKAGGSDVTVLNLYVSGCTLERHYNNLKENLNAYQMQLNGEITDKYISIKDALLMDNWDIVTMQQGSYESYLYDKYEPYLNEIVTAIKTYAKTAKIYVHQTWAYEDGSSKLKDITPYATANDMFLDIQSCYKKMQGQIGGEGIILSGELVNNLTNLGVKGLYRDGFHLSLGLGRYASGLLWYKTLTGKSIDEISIDCLDEPVSTEDERIVKSQINALYSK